MIGFENNPQVHLQKNIWLKDWGKIIFIFNLLENPFPINNIQQFLRTQLKIQKNTQNTQVKSLYQSNTAHGNSFQEKQGITRSNQTCS